MIGWILGRSGLKLPDFLQGGVFFDVSDLSRKRFKVLPVLLRVFFNRFNGRNGYAICLTPFHRVFIRKFRTSPDQTGRWSPASIWWDRVARPPAFANSILVPSLDFSLRSTCQHQDSGFDPSLVEPDLKTEEPFKDVFIRCKIALDGHTLFKSFILIAPAI